jgi:hypothetical protein
LQCARHRTSPLDITCCSTAFEMTALKCVVG